MKESFENKMEIVDFSIETVELALQIIYNRKLPTLNLTRKLDVLKFFDKYAILDLKVGAPVLHLTSSNNIFRIHWKHPWLKTSLSKPSSRLPILPSLSIQSTLKSDAKISWLLAAKWIENLIILTSSIKNSPNKF